MLGMKHAAPHMTAQGSGSIITIASTSGHRAGFSAHSYSAAKAALIHLTRSVAAELSAWNVRVNSVSPGPILTGIFAKAAGQNGAAADRTAETVRGVFERLPPRVQPMPRPGLPEDIARVAAFLASDAAGFVTGQDIAVDGGLTTGRHRARKSEDHHRCRPASDWQAGSLQLDVRDRMDIRTCPVGVHGEPGQRGIPDVEQYGGRRGEFWTAERAIAARLGRVGA
jgi:NAD(P)-dependent dehydrogenase (short-subunit alcohol dehydrogenase family)